jgi:hypothetical protein
MATSGSLILALCHEPQKGAILPLGAGIFCRALLTQGIKILTGVT